VKQISTPLGPECVLTSEELDEEIAARERSDTVRYERQQDSSYVCRECGTAVLKIRVAHPIWDGPFPTSGSGKCRYEEVFYCPSCEREPNPSGAPVAPKGSYHNP
jgi:hypothetical protein